MDEAAKGIMAAVKDSVKSGVLPEKILNDLVMIANIFVPPGASILQRIRINNYRAMRAAIRKALENRPTLEEVLGKKRRPGIPSVIHLKS